MSDTPFDQADEVDVDALREQLRAAEALNAELADENDRLRSDDVVDAELVNTEPWGSQGRLVKVTHQNTATQTDVVRYGTVIEEGDEGVVVGLFPDVIGPLPLDHEIHERVDAPRVEFLDDDAPVGRRLTGA